MFRPQFAYPTPAGYRDEQFHYAFDSFNTPLLSGTVAAGALVSLIPLVLQTDAPFFARGIKVATVGGSNLKIQFKDPWGNYLSSAPLPINLYVNPGGAAGPGFSPVVIEPEIQCPAGGIFWVWLQNTSGAPVAAPAISFYGVKRYKETYISRLGGRIAA